MLKKLLVIAVGALAVGAVLSPAPASASGVISPAYYQATCFGAWGNFIGPSGVLPVDWNADGLTDECFGIGTNRGIYHEWRTSNGWKEMPNGGRADDMVGYVSYANGGKTVIVNVLKSGFYCSSVGASGWQTWVPCYR